MVAARMIRGVCLLVLAVAAAVVAFPSVTSAANVTVASNPGGAVPCATLKLSATPRVNAQNAAHETIKNTVTSCATTPETVTLTQMLSGPFAPANAVNHTWVFTLAPGQSVRHVRRLLYSCCGTYTVTDQVTASGLLLAKKTTSFTFA